MTFTYNSPPASPVDEVRFWSGDTTQQAFSVSDEDIKYLLAPEQYDGNVKAVAADVADRIADYWAASSMSTGGGVKIGPFSVDDGRSASEVEAAWRARADRLRGGGPGGALVMAPGGMFTGSGLPEFSLGMQDYGLQRYPVRNREQERPANGVW